MRRIIQPTLGFNASLYSAMESLLKVDLHRHLTGSIRIDTLFDIARRYEIELPRVKERYDKDWLKQRIIKSGSRAGSLEHFVKSTWSILGAVIANAGPEIVPRVVREAIEDASEDNIKYLELRVAPYGRELPYRPAHPDQKIRKLSFSLRDFLDGLMDGIKYNAAGGIITKIILSLPRHSVGRLPERDRDRYYDILLNFACDYKGKGLVGFDLAGREEGYPPRYFRGFFTRAKDAGFKITIHAGETDSAQSVKEAIELLQADRIGHGIRSCQDDEVLDYLAQKGIPLEICPTSNVITSAVRSLAEHPIRHFFDSGIIVTVNTDDPVVCDTYLTNEYYRLVDEQSFSMEDIEKMIANSIEASFASEPEKAVMRKYFADNSFRSTLMKLHNISL